MKIFDWIFDLRGPQKNVADGYLHVRVEREQKDLKNEKIADKQEINFISSSEETEKTQGLHIGDKVNTKYGKGKLIKKNPGIYKVQLPYGIALLTKNDIEKNESSAKLKKLNRWTSLHDKVDDLYTCHTQFGNWDIVNECIHEKVKFVEKHSAIPLLIGCVAVGAISVASIIMIKKYMKYKLNFSTE